MTRLIVLIDFSPNTNTLLKLAGSWQNKFNTSVLLVHQVPGMVPSLADTKSRVHLLKFEKEQAEKKIHFLVHETFPNPEKVKWETTEQQLVPFLSELLLPNDLILVGLKETGFFKQIFIGSTVTQIIGELNQITVAVPSKLQDLFPEKLVVALSYKYPLNEMAFSQLLNTFASSISKIELITVVTPKDNEDESMAYLSQLQRKMDSLPTNFRIFKGENAIKEIKPYVNRESNNILVVQKGSRSLTDKLFRKLLINDLVYEGAMPLIVLPL